MPYDLNGNARIVNTTVDLGAYEYDAALSTNEFKTFSDFTVYPNPSNSIVHVTSVEAKIETIQIISLDGREIQSVSDSKIDISALSNGIYLLQVKTTEGKTGTKKIVKK